MKKRARPRSYISVYFECCRVYQRIYINVKGTAYVGWCPRCTAKVEAVVSPDGSSDRFFTAG